MVTTAYKSEFTGELFETESEYNVHLEHHKRKEIELQKKKDLVSRTQNLRQQPRLTATSIEDFRQKAFESINQINEFNKTKLLGLFFNNYRFCSVGNSHSKPIDGLSYYDGGNKEILYDGWYGHIVIVYEKDNDVLRRLTEHFPGINTGSGGYNGVEYNGLKGYVLNYGLTLYLDDFPLIKEQHEKYNQIKSSYSELPIS